TDAARIGAIGLEAKNPRTLLLRIPWLSWYVGGEDMQHPALPWNDDTRARYVACRAVLTMQAKCRVQHVDCCRHRQHGAYVVLAQQRHVACLLFPDGLHQSTPLRWRKRQPCAR